MAEHVSKHPKRYTKGWYFSTRNTTGYLERLKFFFLFSKGCLRNRVRNENNSSGMEEKCQKTEEWLVVADEAFISV